MRTTSEHPDTTSATTTMRAVVQERYGTDPSQVLQEHRVPRPEVGPDEVLVRVAAAGVDRGVVHLMTGHPYLVRLAGYGIRRPKQPIPGLDLAGTVVAIGDDVTSFAPGDEVLGIGVGAYAEYAVAPASKLVHRTEELAPEEAAVLSISGLTALQAVRDQADVQPGERVLVVGASGGVGSYAVQIAVAYGAEVTGVASGSKLDAVARMGAHHLIDHTTEEIDARGSDYDVVIDIGGNRSLAALRRVMRRNGRLVIVGGENGGRWTAGTGRQLRAVILSLVVPQTLRPFISGENREDIATLVEMHGRGELTAWVDRVVPIDDAADALAWVMAGRATGKVAIRVG